MVEPSSTFVNPSNPRSSINYNFLGFLALLSIPFLFLSVWCCRNRKGAPTSYAVGDEERPYGGRQAL